MSRPRVSVVIPVHDGERYLAEALHSALAQTEPPLEILVVDDGSTDGSREVAARVPGVTVLSQARAGVAAARNAGIRRSCGELIALLDQDDLWMPEKLARQVDALCANATAAFALCHEIFFSDRGEAMPRWVRPSPAERPVPAYEPSALVAWRKTFAQVGLFDPAFTMAPDSDWFFRAKDLGAQGVMVPELLLRRRMHAHNASGQTERSAIELRRVALASIRRQRAARGEGSR